MMADEKTFFVRWDENRNKARPGTPVYARPIPFSKQRAEEIWNQRGLFHSIEKNMTDGEHAFVSSVWETMPGDTCWMDAFHRIRKGIINCSHSTLHVNDACLFVCDDCGELVGR